MRAFGCNDGACRSLQPDGQRGMVLVSMADKDMADRTAFDCRHQRVEMRVVLWAGIDDRKRISSNNVGIGTVKGERTWIVDRQASNPGRHLDWNAIGRIEGSIEFEAHRNPDHPLMHVESGCRITRKFIYGNRNVRSLAGVPRRVFMNSSIAMPLASLALPQRGAARLAAQAALVIGGTLILTLAAKTKLPLGIVDLNLGTMAVMGIGVAYGWRLAAITLLAYLAEGAAGLPVFQGTPEKGIGLAYMIGPTGGYLVGYVLLAMIAGWAADRGFDRNPIKLAAALTVGAAVVLGLGFAWLSTLIGAEKAWQFGVAPFIYGDLIKVALVASAAPAIWALLGRKA